MGKGKVTEVMAKTFVSLYEKDNLSTREIAAIYSLSKTTIARSLRASDIQLTHSGKFKTLYVVDENYFNVVDTEHKAYWLGLLYADGYNNTNAGMTSIALQEGDRLILDKFTEDLKSNRPLQFINRTDKHPKYLNQYRLNIYSRHVSESLEKLGCINKKSLVLKFPTEEQVPTILISHFIRGMWDGDGSINYHFTNNTKHEYLKNRLQVNCSLTSTEDFGLGLKFLLNKELSINTSIKSYKNRDTTTRNISISGTQQIRTFLKWLYNDATIYLDRKYDKYVEIQDLYKQRGWDLKNKILKTT